MLRHDLGMRYRRTKKASFLGNNDRSKISRCFYAKNLFELLQSGARLIMIDESSIPRYDYRTMKWRMAGDRNAVATKRFKKSQTMIAAVDNFGNKYVSLSQRNSNSETFK